ncbi:beta-ketoacyl synthase chain length factor [Gallaecimonas mangrovi]|uniref:beta-ketoacyl synthase chain length factor n=1 Tax=Gallaecimonas mangrovi TaxID=2291597 RepID=UPI000E20271E|nr:beta-ketoacyl synthase chain length factor [Gallaecimonas mangrovi]
MLRFAVKAWSAWAPGVHQPALWRQWAQNPVLGEPSPPDISWVPAVQRRRLSSLTRIQLACAKQVAGDESLPVIFASRHGELHRTFQLLTDLGQSEPLSPTHFSLSVHNAAAGLFGILRRDKAPANVVVGGDDSLISGLIEAYATLESGADEVLLIAGEQAVPDVYLPYMHNKQVDHALALRLSRGQEVSVSRSDCSSDDNWPMAMQLAALLATGNSGHLHCQGEGWQWQY